MKICELITLHSFYHLLQYALCIASYQIFICTCWGIWSAESRTTHCVHWLCYGVGNQRTGVWCLAGEGIFLFFMVSNWHLGLTHNPMQHVTGNLPLWVRYIMF